MTCILCPDVCFGAGCSLTFVVSVRELFEYVEARRRNVEEEEIEVNCS